jgi:transcriptional regulator with XRE-family HTH domain
MTTLNVASLGEFLREQRTQAQLSLRQLAEQAGVSNPYLSQIERGVRKPSADVLHQIADGLRISAEQLYVRAGLLEDKPESEVAIESAIRADRSITERQKRALIEIYRAFAAETAAARNADGESTPPSPGSPTKATATSAANAAARSTAKATPKSAAARSTSTSKSTSRSRKASAA